jgi:hypothetical protein
MNGAQTKKMVGAYLYASTYCVRGVCQGTKMHDSHGHVFHKDDFDPFCGHYLGPTSKQIDLAKRGHDAQARKQRWPCTPQLVNEMHR